MTGPLDLQASRPREAAPRPREAVPRPRGAPRGNRNALKHGFYARGLPTSEVADLEAHTFQGLQDEIAALRLLNRRAIAHAFSQTDQGPAFQEATRVVIGLTLALNAALRTHLELELYGGQSADNRLISALEKVRQQMAAEAPEDPAASASQFHWQPDRPGDPPSG